MIRKLFLLFIILELVSGQSGLDILNTPTDARDAALGINLNPTVKPNLLITDPEHNVTLSVWNWVADIQGAYMGLGLKHAYLNVQAMHSGELEYRHDIPSVEPLSTFEYTLFNAGGAYARQWGQLILGVGSELLYERSLNASASGLSFNLATAYELSSQYSLSAGIRHIGVTGKLDEESSSLPTEIWTEVDVDLRDLHLVTEFNNGSIPFALGLAYPLFDRFELMGGLQFESADPSMRIHSSIGFTAAWTSFTFGYSIYQLDHNLGPRHFISLYWNY